MSALFEDAGIFVIKHRSFLLGIRNILHNSCVENQNLYFLCTNGFYVNRAIYEIRWKNIAEPDRPRTTIKHGACALHAG